MTFISFRRYYLDSILKKFKYYGKVLDVGGKKENKRGCFRPPLKKVVSWEYLNTDAGTNPDYLCSADDIPLDDNYFDIILMTEVLEHLEKPVDVLEECYRVLKKEGKLIATMPFLYPIHADPYDFQRWTPSRFEITLSNLGYKDINIIPMGSYFAVWYDITMLALKGGSKNSQSFKNRVIRKFLMPIVREICFWGERKYFYKSEKITTGYYVEASK